MNKMMESVFPDEIRNTNKMIVGSKKNGWSLAAADSSESPDNIGTTPDVKGPATPEVTEVTNRHSKKNNSLFALDNGYFRNWVNNLLLGGQ